MIGAFFVELGGKYIATYLSRPLEVYITKSELQCMIFFLINQEMGERVSQDEKQTMNNNNKKTLNVLQIHKGGWKKKH